MATKGIPYLDSVTGKVPASQVLVASETAHASFRSPGTSSGTFHCFGFIEAPATDANLNQGSTTQACGTAENPYGAHAFVVCSGAGSASGGSGAVTLTITGTSITSAGVRTPGDTETLIADITAAVQNKFVESSKYWLGEITFTLDVGATGHTAYALDFNYGLIKKFDFWDQSVTLTGFECTGRGGGTDANFDVEILYIKPNATDWTYHATAFVPGPTALAKLTTDCGAESNLADKKRFYWGRSGLSQAIAGASHEGVIVRITTSANNAVESMDMRLRYSVNA